MECIICCEVKKPVICISCNSAFCMLCYEKCLLLNPNNCANCSNYLLYSFLKINLSKKFLNGEFKRVKIDRIILAEKSEDLRLKKIAEANELTRYRELVSLIRRHWECTYIRSRDLNSKSRDIFDLMNNIYINGFNIPPPINHHTSICPDQNCTGKVIHNTCNLCLCVICEECGVIKKNQHICNEEDILSKVFLDETTKPCPNCDTNISKIMGCNQMYCVKCKYKFDWTSGKEIKSHFHNPHYFEDLRNNDPAPIPNITHNTALSKRYYDTCQKLSASIGINSIRKKNRNETKEVIAEKIYKKQIKDETVMEIIRIMKESEPKIKALLIDKRHILPFDKQDDILYELYLMTQKLKELTLTALQKRQVLLVTDY